MPWRKTKDPYKILVSEIMLQQTQVDRVVPYYERFLKKFPTVQALARASLVDVLRAWSGLGYNRRAKYLHDAAKHIAGMSMFPRSCEELRALPGVGDYTAKAVRVFAYNEPEVLIETNVRTVFLHHFFPHAKKVDDKKLLSFIEKALSGQDPRTLYAALMDYGSHLKLMHQNPSRRSKHHVQQSKFEGSLRQVRGEIVRAMTDQRQLEELREKYASRFERAFQSLVKDGLIRSQ